MPHSAGHPIERRCATRMQTFPALSCTRMGYCRRRGRIWSATTCRLLVGGMPCRLTGTGARSAVRCSNMLNILLNMKMLIPLARSAEARRSSTYPRHSCRKRPEKAELCPRGSRGHSNVGSAPADGSALAHSRRRPCDGVFCRFLPLKPSGRRGCPQGASRERATIQTRRTAEIAHGLPRAEKSSARKTNGRKEITFARPTFCTDLGRRMLQSR